MKKSSFVYSQHGNIPGESEVKQVNAVRTEKMHHLVQMTQHRATISMSKMYARQGGQIEVELCSYQWLLFFVLLCTRF